MVKCCWDECNKKATCGVSTNDSKGALRMCEDCYSTYHKHCNAREEGFADKSIQIMKEKLEETEKEILEMFHPELKYGLSGARKVKK